MDNVTDNAYIKIQMINKVGVSRLKQDAKRNHPRENFERNLAVIRDIAHHGYTASAMIHGITPNYAFVILDKYYKRAMKMERGGENG